MPKFLSKIGLSQKFLVAGLAGFAVSLTLVFHFFYKKNQGDPVPSSTSMPINRQEAVKAEKDSSDPPMRLRIPKINIDTSIERVGLTSDGAVDVPKNPANAGWFDRGPRPGERGSSVIDGHYGWRENAETVFNNLSKLGKGDKIYVENERGATTVFVVRKKREYAPDAHAPEIFISNDGKAHLNLITCEGVWDHISNSYPKRLVVFADKE